VRTDGASGHDAQVAPFNLCLENFSQHEQHVGEILPSRARMARVACNCTSSAQFVPVELMFTARMGTHV
jgi:hypothetical protein